MSCLGQLQRQILSGLHEPAAVAVHCVCVVQQSWWWPAHMLVLIGHVITWCCHGALLPSYICIYILTSICIVNCKSSTNHVCCSWQASPAVCPPCKMLNTPQLTRLLGSVLLLLSLLHGYGPALPVCRWWPQDHQG